MLVTKLNNILTRIYFYIRIKASKNQKKYENSIIFSSDSQRYSDNTKYLFEYLREKGYNVYYITSSPNCTRKLPYKSPEYFAALKGCNAILFTHLENDISPYIPKDVLKINLWHGSPIKKMGFDSPTDQPNLKKLYFAKSRIPYNRWHYIVIQHTLFTEPFRSAFRCQPKKLLPLGQPRNDIFFKNTEAIQSEIKEKLNINENLHIISYAPTFRDNKLNISDYCKSIKELVNELPGYQALIRLHPYDRSSLPSDFFTERVIDASAIEDPQHLLLITNTLITDYSSICFDFAALGRKIILYCPDREEYEKSRGGLYFALENLPFIYCRNCTEVKNAILQPHWNTEYSKLTQPGSCERMESFLLDQNVLCGKQSRPSTQISE